MKKILETLKRKWAEYLLEIFVIIIGIISAFLLNSWNESRKEKNFERQVLKEVYASIQNNIFHLDLAIEHNQEALLSCNLILDYFQDELTYHDSLDRHFSMALVWNYPTLNNNAYESLKSFGLHLISNDSIRKFLGDIYEWKLIERISIRQEEYFYNTVSPMLSDWFESYTWFGEMKPLNYQDLRKSTKYKHVLNTLISNRKTQIFLFRRIHQDRVKLADMITNELNKE